MADAPKRPGNTPVERQERPADEAAATRPQRRTVSGPGAADFIAAPGGLDTPESGAKGTGYVRDEGVLDRERDRMVPRPGPDTEAVPGEREPDESISGSQTGTIGGGGPHASKTKTGGKRGDDR